MVTKSHVKKEFDDLTRKIAKLESLRRQLDVLDTRGFETDARLIRSKLHDVNSLPQVVRDMNSLRRKIKNRQVKRTTGKKHARSHRKHQVNSLKKRHLAIERKIENLKLLLAKKRKVSVKKQLTKTQMEFVRDVPKLERQLRLMRIDFKKHMKARKIKIDAGVGLLVNTQFDDFVVAIKAELTHRLKKKELLMDTQLKADLQSHKKIFAARYGELVRKFHVRYKNDLSKKLKREVKRKFDDALNEALNEEKQKLVDSLLKKNAQRLGEEKKKMAVQLHDRYERQYEHKKKHLLMQQKKDVNSVMREYAQQRDKLNEKRASLRKREKLLAGKRKKVMVVLKRARRKNQDKISTVRKDEQEAIANVRKQAEFELKQYKNKFNAKFSGKWKRLQKRSNALKAKEVELAARDEADQATVERERAALKQKLKARSALLKRKGKLLQIQKSHMEIAFNKKLDGHAALLKRKGKWLQAQRLRMEIAFNKKLDMHAALLKRKMKRLQAQKVRARNSLAREKAALQNENQRVKEHESMHIKKAEAKIALKLAQERAEIKKHGWELYTSLSKEKAKVIRHKQALSAQYVRKRKRLREDVSASRKRERVLVSKYAQARGNLNKERIELQRNLAKVKKDEQNVLKLVGEEVERKVAQHRRDMSTKFERQKFLLKNEARHELQIELRALKGRHEKMLRSELKKKEKKLRQTFEREYKQRFTSELKRKNLEFDKKKQALEAHIVANAKKLFM